MTRGVAVERMFSAIAARYDFLRGLREMHRVLKAGSRAVVLEFTTPPGRAFRRLYLQQSAISGRRSVLDVRGRGLRVLSSFPE